MIRGSCPICAKKYQIDTLDDLPSFPFCTDRCRLVDLGRWIDGRNAIPAAPGTRATQDDEGAAAEDDEG
jgi:endogenous inhibitor of DNA gyrase (YacG/DUF329 family)